MTMSIVNAGDHVTIPWGLEEVSGTVLSLFGPPGRQFARVEVELLGDEDKPMFETVSLPVDLLTPVHAT